MKKITYTLLLTILTLSLSAQVKFADAPSDSVANDSTENNIISTPLTETSELKTESDKEKKPVVYIFEIKENIAAPIWRTVKLAFKEAEEMNAELVIIDMNTYGGEVSAADSIRTHILNSKIPVYVFINDNAASAGALISIACDSIYMKPSAKMGAATVVNQSGEQVPDKFQSYMRATMRATAEAQGKDTIVSNGDTSYVWRRNPAIAEAMVDPKIYVAGVSDTGQVLTFTASEAIKHNYCEGIVDSRLDLIEKAAIKEYTIEEYKPTSMDKVIGVLISPYISGILIMVIIGGIYFELQSPGIGFPLIASILAALLYFAPLYLEGLAENWELLLFVAGIILLIVELFVVPGFGVAGIAGVIAVIMGLTLSLIDNEALKDLNFTGEGMGLLLRSLGVVVLSATIGLIVSIWSANRILTSYTFQNLALQKEQNVSDGYIGVSQEQINLIGKTGIAHTVLRPSGKVSIDDKIYDAKSEYGLIDKGEKIKIIRYETGQVYVTKA